MTLALRKERSNTTKEEDGILVVVGNHFNYIRGRALAASSKLQEDTRMPRPWWNSSMPPCKWEIARRPLSGWDEYKQVMDVFMNNAIIHGRLTVPLNRGNKGLSCFKKETCKW